MIVGMIAILLGIIRSNMPSVKNRIITNYFIKSAEMAHPCKKTEIATLGNIGVTIDSQKIICTKL